MSARRSTSESPSSKPTAMPTTPQSAADLRACQLTQLHHDADCGGPFYSFADAVTRLPAVRAASHIIHRREAILFGNSERHRWSPRLIAPEGPSLLEGTTG